MLQIEWVREQYPDLLVMDGFDDCILGVMHGAGSEAKVAYDLESVLDKLQADGMTREEAEEFWSFNQLGAYVGPHSPAFLERAAS